ncbi:MAG: hypothetical protein SFV32_09230 [Opitutaceae bacterium]|nr:hypothetical protein [Opitutaceae bacterium]
MRNPLVLFLLLALSVLGLRAEKPAPYLEQPPRILTWKWGTEVLDQPGLIEEYIADISARSDFDLLYQNLHWLGLSWFDTRLQDMTARAGHAARKAGMKFIIDLDVRDEGDAFIAEFPNKAAYFGSVIEIPLDGQGKGKAVLDQVVLDRWHRKRPTNADGILRAWSLTTADKDHYVPDSLADIRESVTLEKLSEGRVAIHVNAGAAHAGKLAAVVPTYRHLLPDLFAQETFDYFIRMLELLKGLPIDGAGYGEWGQSPIFLWKPETHFRHFPWSVDMGKAYAAKTGRVLEDELLLFRFAPVGGDAARFRAINDYLELFREQNAKCEEFFYAKIKEYFGPRAMVMDHPTFAVLPMDVLYNGVHWWQARRDYAQTDEDIPMSVRLALGHKWGSPVWYNMFYSGGTLRLDTYFRETWRNVAFGGRTNYLGYVCSNRTIDAGVLELRPENRLDLVAQMEKQVRLLDAQDLGLPNSRLAVVFGYEAATNWMLRPDFEFKWDWRHPIANEVFSTAEELFDKENLLFDLIPSSEIANGSLVLSGDKLVYGSHNYDAVVFLHLEGAKPEVFDFIGMLKSVGVKHAVYGPVTRLDDGSDGTGAYKKAVAGAEHVSTKMPHAEEIAALARKWNIPFNKWASGSLYKDGTAVFAVTTTRDGTPLSATGNPLKVDEVINGWRVEFEGVDFLCIKLREDGTVARLVSGPKKYLRITRAAK